MTPTVLVKLSDAGLYAYFNMGMHYICHYFTPSESEVQNLDKCNAYPCRCKILTNIMPTHAKISIEPQKKSDEVNLLSLSIFIAFL
jgi:hypothetical protein